MTEDDTFTMLKRVTFAEMEQLYRSWDIEYGKGDYEPWIIERKELFRENGWDVNEWLVYRNKKNDYTI